MKYDDLVEELGEFGPYQRKVYVITCLPAAVAAIQTLVSVFILAVPEHRCSVPGLSNDTFERRGLYQEELINWTLPWTDFDPDDDTNPWGSAQCEVYVNRTASNFNSYTSMEPTNDTTSCNAWAFDTSVFKNTFVTEEKLVCDDKALKSHANSIYMAGLLVGSIFYGVLSDWKGRKTAVILALLVQCVSAISTAFAPNWWVFVVLRFLTATGNMGLFMCTFVLSMELVGRAWRTFAGVAIQLFWGGGMFVLTAIAYFVRDWVDLQLATSIYATTLICLYWLMPESPRWLITQGRAQEAKDVLEKIARANGKTLPPEAKDVINNTGDKEETSKNEGLLTIFSYPVLAFRAMVIFVNWFVVVMVYYGLTLNVGSLGGSIYLNFFLSGAVETLANIVTIWALPRMGRKKFHCISMLVGGVANVSFLIPVLVGGGNITWVGIVLSNIGKFGATGGFSTIYVYTAELFPTNLRNSVVGTSSMVARIGGIISPYVADLGTLVGGKFGTSLPYVVFGLSGLLAGLLALMLPETLDQKLPETIQDAVHFGKNKASEPEPTPTSVTKGDKDGIELSNKEVSNGDSKGHLNQAFHVERF